MKAERAVEKVRERLLRTARALEQAGIPFAVVGGNAVAIWVESVDSGATRNTRDVDILISRADLQAVTTAMVDAGFMRQDVHGLTMFLDREDPMPSRGVHVVFAGEPVRPEYQHPAPDIQNVKWSPEGVPAVGLAELVAMKLTSFRDLDRVHIRDMLRVGLIGPDWVDRVPPALRPRLEEILADPDG